MGNTSSTNLLLLGLLFTLFCFSAQAIKGSRVEGVAPYLSSHLPREFHLSGTNEHFAKRNSRRLMIGSTAPHCTYNECRGCRYKCRAEQVPVEGNDPINSPYRYRCVCHR